VRIKPFRALHPPPERAGEVACVPYDVVDTEEARALAAGNPASCLHVIRSEIDFPPGTNPYADEVYAQAATNFARFQAEGLLVRDPQAHFYVYRQKMGDHVQRGVVACCHIDDYQSDVIRKHERTRRDKEDDRTRHIGTLSAHTGLVFLAYRDQAAIDRLVAAVEAGQPLCRFVAPDGVEHTVWAAPAATGLAEAFQRVPLCYIADGHHRAAASARVGRERAQANPQHRGDEEYNWFLGVLFPATQLRILPINRLVKDLNGLSPEQFLDKLRGVGTLEPAAAGTPASRGEVLVFVNGGWWSLAFPPASIDHTDPIASLDVSLLQDRVLAPILGIGDPRTDERIEFVGGIRGTDELERRAGAGGVAFSMHATSPDELLAVADAGEIMPPKSTWFEPKLRSGLFVHEFERIPGADA